MNLPSVISWTPTYGVRILDQTLLPTEERYVELDSVEAMAEAIERLRVRGAPLIGIAAAMGLVQAANGAGDGRMDRQRVLTEVGRAYTRLRATRPTAVNLTWALDRMRRCAESVAGDAAAMRAALIAEADVIWKEERERCERIGSAGMALLGDGATVLTHCNTGALATGGLGTALAPIYLARQTGRRVEVVATETRPLLQGSRLTAWELARAGIRCTIIADGMVASRLSRGDITCAIVGADRIAANGDVANKIGTYGIALAARAHGVPFYVAAPRSTIDLATPDGGAIPIEERRSEEIAVWNGIPTAPEGTAVWNPAFDVTPAALITGIITEDGIIAPENVGARHASPLRD